MKKNTLKSIVVFCLATFFCSAVFAEGSREVMPALTSKGQLCLNRSRNLFGLYGASPEFRLHVTIADASEKIRFGFGKVLGDNGQDLVFRIKDPAGNIVRPEAAVPTSGPGFISSYNQALAGPQPAAGGYDYLEIHNLTKGDYYFEFNYSGPINDANRRYLEFFDISVVKPGDKVINGRVWSKAWQFWSGSDGYSTYDKFYGKLMILSDDSIVTQVDCNGFRGGSFSFSSNKTGCDNTGSTVDDRKSRPGFSTYPQYKVFLNDPDSILFPTQKAASGLAGPVLLRTNCNGSVEFSIRVEKDCTIKLFVDVNPNPGADPEDVQIIANLLAHPGGDGYNKLTWDGNDNLGRPVFNGKPLTFAVTNLSGLTNLPIFDIENNDNGLIVKQVRPGGGAPLKIYWDDSRIAANSSNITNGCNNTGGCHTWMNDFGDNNTINTWWFVTGTQLSSSPFVAKRRPALPVISGKSVHCAGEGTLDFEVTADQGSTSYNWSYSGKGVTIEAIGLTARLNFTASAMPGNLSVYGLNDSCGAGPAAVLAITFEALPEVLMEAFPDICYTSPVVKLSGGRPSGGEYFVNGVKTDSIFPYKLPEGKYNVVYTYTKPVVGCKNSASASLMLIGGPACEGTAYFPTAFSPGSDTINDTFKPVAKNIYSFTMNIFNRWGQLIYTTNNVSQGWDGTFRGEDCPIGVYTFEATYAPSLRNDVQRSQRGSFRLLR